MECRLRKLYLPPRNPSWFQMQGLPAARSAFRAMRGARWFQMQGLPAAKAAFRAMHGAGWFQMQGLPAARSAFRAMHGARWLHLQGVRTTQAASHPTGLRGWLHSQLVGTRTPNKRGWRVASPGTWRMETRNDYAQPLPAEPKSTMSSLARVTIASRPGFRSLRGS